MNGEDQGYEVPDAAKELKAMQGVADALKPLNHDGVLRVLSWVADLYRVSPPSGGGDKRGHHPTASADAHAAPSEADISMAHFSDVAELYHAASPGTDVERALVVGYWFQQCLGQGDFDGQQVNNELKHLGYAVTNITRAFDGLQGRKPQLAMQTRKTGTSRQARKKYRLTHSGLRAVERMISGSRDQDEG